MTQPVEFEQVTYNDSEGAQICDSAAKKIGFYGITPIAQRSYTAAVHLSSELAASASFGATQLAAVNEIQKTLVALGIWATA
jgi:hypothetical protein|tara:strand:- start:833 stop:1078 length:246 start_codon:yes stop_codon:yes gene_type:complete